MRSRRRDRPSRVFIWSQLRPLLGDRRAAVMTLSITSLLSGFTEAGVLAVVAQVAASLVSGATQVHVALGPVDIHATIGALLAVACGLAVVRLALQVPISILPARIAADVQAGLRMRLFGAFTYASWSAQSSDREGHLQEMMTNQVVQATLGALQAAILVTAVITFLVLMASALVLNPAGAIVVLATAVSLFGLLRPLSALGHRRSRELSQAQMEYAGGIGEAVRLAEETHVFGVASAQRARVEGLVASAQDLFFRTQTLGRLIPNIYQSLLFLVIVLGLAAIYGAGVRHVASLGAVVLLLVRAGTYGQQIQGGYQMVRQALPFVERLQEAQQRYLASSPVVGELPLTTIQTVAFKDVSFAYRSGNNILKGISFEVARGEVIGVVGPSGAGKSTLVQILLQLRAPGGGNYLVNGESAERFSSDDWHQLVAYVPQEPRLLHGTVADNIRYFRDLNDDVVEHAARLARIHKSVMEWPDGYQTIIGPRADAVSGGQQQRICLARALVAQPQVLVLDEPTSALDPHSENLIQESLIGLKGQMTLFIVAHRMSTLDVCDRVMVVVDGKLEAFDTIALLQRNSYYYRSATTLAAGASGVG
jgi:ATP-binding cassette subfamily B protein